MIHIRYMHSCLTKQDTWPQKGLLQLYIRTELIMWKSLPLINTSDIVMNLNSDSCLDGWLRLVVGLGVTGSVTCNG